MSADVLLERIREQAERRGLLWMAPDVITFVITIPVYGQCLETIKFAISYPRVSGIIQVGSVYRLQTQATLPGKCYSVWK
jgi:hypothetical protein